MTINLMTLLYNLSENERSARNVNRIRRKRAEESARPVLDRSGRAGCVLRIVQDFFAAGPPSSIT